MPDSSVVGAHVDGTGAARGDSSCSGLPGVPRLTLLTCGHCHLCERAKLAMGEVARAAGEQWAQVDVSADPEVHAEYALRLPVVLLDGQEHGYWRVDRDRLLRDLGR